MPNLINMTYIDRNINLDTFTEEADSFLMQGMLQIYAEYAAKKDMHFTQASPERRLKTLQAMAGTRCEKP